MAQLYTFNDFKKMLLSEAGLLEPEYLSDEQIEKRNQMLDLFNKYETDRNEKTRHKIQMQINSIVDSCLLETLGTH